jgi:hypothetical protein
MIASLCGIVTLRPTQIPVDSPRRWPDEVADERVEILDRQWQVDAINAQCRERRVVNPWRTRMADRITDHPKDRDSSRVSDSTR